MGKKSGKKDSGHKYTRMYVGALGMGFNTDDLKLMPFDRLQWFIHCNNLNNGAEEEEPEYRQGTVSELKRIL